MRRFAWLALGALALAAAPAPAAAQTPSKCAAAQYKAAGKYALALAGCRAKAVAKGVPVAAPATSGPCCVDPDISGGCAGGPDVGLEACSFGGGTGFGDASCTPAGECVAP